MKLLTNIPWRKLLFITPPTLLILLLGYFAVENYSGPRQLKKSDQALAKQGVIFDLDKLYPTLPEPEDNFAESKFISSIFNYNRETDHNRLLSAIKTPYIYFNPWTYDSPLTPFTAGKTQLEGRALIDELSPIVIQDTEVIEEIDSRLNSGSAISRMQPDAAIFNLLGPLSTFRSLAQFNQIRARLSIEKGDRVTAIKALKANIHLSELCNSSNKCIASIIVNTNINRINQDIIWQGLITDFWHEDDFLNFISWLPTTEKRASEYINSINGEIAYSRKTIEARQVYWHNNRKINFSMFDDDLWWTAYIPKGSWKYNMVYNQESIYHYLYQPLSKLDFKSSPSYNVPTKKSPRTFILTAGFSASANFEAARLSIARSLVYEKLTRIACAIRLYQLKNDRLPANLNALMPQYIKDADDLMDPGKQLVYRIDSKEKQHWTLYSVGQNLVDDGGQVKWTNSGRRSSEVGDWASAVPLLKAPK